MSLGEFCPSTICERPPRPVTGLSGPRVAGHAQGCPLPPGGGYTTPPDPAEALRGSFAKHKTGPESRFAKRRSKTIGLRLAADCSNVVVLRWRSTYCQTPSKYLLRPRVLERLFGVLQEAHDRACTEIRCGVEVGDIFRVAQDHVTKNASNACTGYRTD